MFCNLSSLQSQAQWCFTCSHQGKACNLIKLQVQSSWQSLRESNGNNITDRQAVKRSESTWNCTLLKKILQLRSQKCCLQWCPWLPGVEPLDYVGMLLLNELRKRVEFVYSFNSLVGSGENSQWCKPLVLDLVPELWQHPVWEYLTPELYFLLLLF